MSTATVIRFRITPRVWIDQPVQRDSELGVDLDQSFPPRPPYAGPVPSPPHHQPVRPRPYGPSAVTPTTPERQRSPLPGRGRAPPPPTTTAAAAHQKVREHQRELASQHLLVDHHQPEYAPPPANCQELCTDTIILILSDRGCLRPPPRRGAGSGNQISCRPPSASHDPSGAELSRAQTRPSSSSSPGGSCRPSRTTMPSTSCLRSCSRTVGSATSPAGAGRVTFARAVVDILESRRCRPPRPPACPA